MTAPLNTHFTPQTFLQYFRAHDELTVPEDQPFIIEEIGPLSENEPGEILPNTSLRIFSYVLSKIFSCLGQTATFIYSGDLEFTYKSRIFLKSSKPFIIKTEKNDLYVRFTSLFKLMIAYSVNEIELAPNQAFGDVCGGLDDDLKEVSKKASSKIKQEHVLVSTLPMGMRLRIAGVEEPMQTEYYLGPYGPFVALRHMKKIVLKLEDTFSFNSLTSFLDRLSVSNLELPANQMVCIRDEEIGAFRQAHKLHLKGILDRNDFILKQLALKLGKTVSINGKVYLTCKRGDSNSFKITAVNDCLIGLSDPSKIAVSLDHVRFDFQKETNRLRGIGRSILVDKKKIDYANVWKLADVLIKNGISVSGMSGHLEQSIAYQFARKII